MKSNHVFAFILIILGIIFLLESLRIIPGISRVWPIFTVLLGLGFLLISYINKTKNPTQLSIGILILLLSILFFYLNFTSWTKMKILWPINIIIVGISISSCFIKLRNKIFLYIGLLLISLGIIFFLVFAVSAQLWPISLIIVGLSFIFLKPYNEEKKTALTNRGKKKK